MKKKYAVAYARVSDPRQAEKGVSINAQLEAMRKWAANNNVEIVEEDADEGKSAYREDIKRPKFERLLELAKRDTRISIFLVHDASRFCRRRRKANILKDGLDEYGVKVIATTTPYDTNTIQGIWMESIDETRSEAESRATSLHVLEKMKGHISIRDPETGWFYKNGGRAPAGYRNVRVQRGVDHRGLPEYKLLWELDPEWSAILRDIVVNCKIEKRMSHKKIVEYLNSQGIKSPEGRPICVSFINEIFREDRLLQAAGYAFWNREDRQSKGKRFKDKEEWVKVPNAHPAIITEEEARKAREVCGQSTRSKVPPRLPDSSWLFTGKNLNGEDFFVCMACGARMASFIKGGRYKNKYRCGTVTYQGKNACHDVKINKEDFETEIVNQIKSRFTPEAVDSLVDEVAAAIEAETGEYKDSVKKIDKEIKNKQNEINNLVTAVARGENVDIFNEAIETRRREMEELNKQKEQLALNRPVVDKIDAIKLRNYIESLDKVLSQGSNRERREFIRTFIRRMEFDPVSKKITIYWYSDPIQVQKKDLCEYKNVGVFDGVGGGT